MAAAHHHQASSSSSSASGSSSSYEVFLSFHGEDVRTNFADYLYNSLVHAGIRTFRDENELHKGNKIEKELIDAIQQSRISIPIFSENYASSKWCLNELTEITECRRRTRDQMVVMPIFYKVEPRDVRNQTGISYAKAFEDHQKSFDETTVQKWKKALREVGELDGWLSKKDTYEGTLIKEVVKTVWSTLNERPLSVSNNLVGIQSHIKEMQKRLDIESNERKIVVIHGLGGVGKTTIARAIYNIVFHHFEGHSFIENARENTQKHGLLHLQKQIIFNILKQDVQNITSVDDGIKVIKERFCQRKVLIVLDDVDQDDQANSLVGDGEWFGIGSKIIITSRSKDILIARKADGIYEPNVMNPDDSLELFSLHAFGRDRPLEDYLDLSKAMVKTTGGLPLALQVIGSSLYLKEKSIWEEMLRKIQKVPNEDVMKRLKISYDGLKDDEKHMFLDTACFFIGMNKNIACHIWDGCGFFPLLGLDVLCLRSLVSISEKGELRMHDLLRDLGRQIVCQESINEPGERSRIWSQEEVLDILDKQTGTRNVKGLSIIFKYKSRSKCLKSKGFAAMKKLRLLQVDHAEISGNLRNSFSELTWLSWKGCRDLNALTNFHPQKLVVLDLSNSEITEKRMGWKFNKVSTKKFIKMAINLKVLDLSYCCKLSGTLDLSENRQLEVLILKYCENLVKMDTSNGYLKNLVTLDMSGCERLNKLPEKLGLMTSLKSLNLNECYGLNKLPEELDLLTSLTTLDLGGCSRLESLPDLPRHLEVLILNNCEKLVEIHKSIGNLRNLVTLNIRSCRSLVDLPIEICQLTSLKTLDLSFCGSLTKLPEKMGDMISLTKLKLSSCNTLKSLPNLPPHLEVLKLDRCTNLVDPSMQIYQLTLKKLHLCLCNSPNKQLPEELGRMVSLTTLGLSYCNTVESLPNLPPNLKVLNLRECGKLLHITNLPLGLTKLSVYHCESMVKLSSRSGLRNLENLSLNHCNSLEEIEGVDEDDEGLDSLVHFTMSSCYSLKKLPNLSNSKKLRYLQISYCLTVTEIDGVEKLESLDWLDISGCESLERLPDLSRLKKLQRLDAKGKKLTEIEAVNGLESLVVLNISGCESLERLPDLSSLKKLQRLYATDCKKLTEIEALNGLESLVELYISRCESLERLPNLSILKKLRWLYAEDCKKLTEIQALNGLEVLDISGCESLERLPDLSSLKKLQSLYAKDCKKLTEIQAVNGLESLTFLDVTGCISLKKLPEVLTNFKKQQRGRNLFKVPFSLSTEIAGVYRREL